MRGRSGFVRELGRWGLSVAGLRVISVAILGMSLGLTGCRGSSPCPRGTHLASAPGPASGKAAALRVCVSDDPAGPSLGLIFDSVGRKREQCPLQGTTLEGPYLAWHADGTLFLRGFFREGQKQGRWEQWAPGGAFVAEGSYREGALVSGAPVGSSATCEAQVFPR